MNKLLLTLLSCACACAVYAGAPAASVPVPSAIPGELDSLVVRNDCLEEHLSELRSQLEKVDISLAEHRLREGFFSDILGANISWFAVIIGLLGAGFGLVAWRRYNEMEKLMAQTRTDIATEMQTALDAHCRQEERTFRGIEKDRILLRKDMGNQFVVSVKHSAVNPASVIQLYILQFRNSLFEYDFFYSLCESNKQTILNGRAAEVLLTRMRLFERAVDKFIKEEAHLHTGLRRLLKIFSEVRLADELADKTEIESIRRRILVKLERYMDEQEKAAGAKATA